MLTKHIASTLLYFILFMGTSLSWGASDSTAPPFTSGITPSVSSNQPFLLDSGYADVSNIQTTTQCTANSDNSIPAGAVWIDRYTPPATLGNPYAIRMTVCSNAHLCPTNFTPVAIVNPYKSLGQGNESMRACVDSLSVNGLRYWFGVWVNTVLDGSNNMVPATSFYWSIYCYPSNSYSTTGNPTSIDGLSSSACGPTINNYAPAILLWDSGFINHPQDITPLFPIFPGLYNLPTNRICPANYQPYVQMRSNYELGSDNSRLLVGHGICVVNITNNQSPLNYTILYMINSRYVNIQVALSGNDSSKYYAWRKSGSSPEINNYRDPYPIVNSVDISGIQSAPTDAGRIEWTLYCYPPGYSPPNYTSDANCQPGVAPFWTP